MASAPTLSHSEAEPQSLHKVLGSPLPPAWKGRGGMVFTRGIYQEAKGSLGSPDQQVWSHPEYLGSAKNSFEGDLLVLTQAPQPSTTDDWVGMELALGRRVSLGMVKPFRYLERTGQRSGLFFAVGCQVCCI